MNAVFRSKRHSSHLTNIIVATENIVCSDCSRHSFNEHRICNKCHILVQAAQSPHFSYFDSDDEEREELSPLNTPMLSARSAKEYSAETTHYRFESMDDLMIGSCCQVDTDDDVWSSHPMSVDKQREEDESKRDLVYGFVRTIWRELLQFDSHRYPSEHILAGIIAWLSISDCIDEMHTNLNIIVSSNQLFQFKNYRKVQTIERIKPWNMSCYHSFGQDIVTNGANKLWKFKISSANKQHQRSCVSIGIIEADKVCKFLSSDRRNNACFNDEFNGGYCLYTGDWKKYHNDTNHGMAFLKKREDVLDITPNDVITVQLDLRPKYNENGNIENKCGVLRYILNGSDAVFRDDGIAFDDIDINKSYKVAIGMYLQDKVAMFQVL